MKDIQKKIGQLRQWLNEERITDPKKMVTNEELLMRKRYEGKYILDKLVAFLDIYSSL
jgi:hypothetical protein